MNSFKKLRFPNQKNRIYTMAQTTLKMCELVIEEAEKYNMTDEQFFLNWEDKLNELSIKDHFKG